MTWIMWQKGEGKVDMDTATLYINDSVDAYSNPFTIHGIFNKILKYEE